MSPETQARRLRDVADVSGWDLTIREEDAASAKSLDGRPVLAAALADLDTGRADVLAIAALDRLAQSTRDFADVLDRSEREGWSVACLDLGVDTSTDSGRLVADIRAAVAQWEGRIIASRTREGMATIRATTGKHTGRPSDIPTGVEERIYDLARPATGQRLSASAIAQLMEDEGVARPTAPVKILAPLPCSCCRPAPADPQTFALTSRSSRCLCAARWWNTDLRTRPKGGRLRGELRPHLYRDITRTSVARPQSTVHLS